MERKFQPYEAHLQYLLQFMTDYNLYGCGYVEAEKVCFRAPVPERENTDDSVHKWHSQSVPPACITDDADHPRVSYCSIEVDICVQDILNRREVKERQLHHDFIERNNPFPSDLKLVHSMAGLWRDETKRRKRRMNITNPGSSPFPTEALVSMSADPRNSQNAGWVHEEEYKERVGELIKQEEEQNGQRNASFETFVQSHPLEGTVQTLLQSVEDLFPEKLASALPMLDQIPEEDQNPTNSILVDEDRILGINKDNDGPFPDDSDEENLRAAKSSKERPAHGGKVLSRRSSEEPKTSDESVVGRTAKSISEQPAVIDSNMKRQDHSAALFGGIAASCLRTGKRPKIPLSRDLLHAAEKQGLVSRSPGTTEESQHDESSSKRSLSPVPTEPEPKRRRVEFALDTDFDPTGSSQANFGIKLHLTSESRRYDLSYKDARRECTLRSWEIGDRPPTFDEVRTWWNETKEAAKRSPQPVLKISDRELRPYLSQVDGPTPRNKHGFKYSQKRESTSVQHEAQYMSIMSLEIHVNSRGKLVPNPEEDEVQCIFWCSKSDGNFSTSDQASLTVHSGIVVLSEDASVAQRIQKQTSIEVVEERSELDLMTRMVEIVRTHDPDILIGYEVHGSSWGYLIERARSKYDYNLCDEFSRMKSQSFGRFGKEADRWGFNTTSTIRVTGRHMINIWRAMRGELNLLQYTMENVVWHLLHRRIPHYAWQMLTEWYTSGKNRDLSKLLRYYLRRTKLDVEILEANELIPRTSEQARLLGVDFFSVFSRGSQFKVESIMFRIAKPENFILVSPDRKQVGSQNALECLPLVMEPQSAFYNSPLLVLDFQSLYPSVMIAYNYCYSTFLGRIVSWRGASKMGFTDYQRQEGLLSLLQDYINIAPNGMMYCKPEVRKSLLAKMLTEILETRLMVKSGMKQDKEDRTLQQLLNNRQLALKLLANVTYGYASASFSGRMPCSEIADSIVQTARETLEKAIALIHSVEKWNAEVVYGDTDSLFVYLPGRTRDQAFDIGNEIAKAITDMNPRPVKLKFEKVYHPCVLLAKKRYVGYKYESKDQVKPDFDAKGIETVRRDGTPAEQKIEEKALKILFETADLSQVKSYFQRQCEKIMRGAVSIQDFCFAREVKLGTYSDRGPPPPGALISTRRMLGDARAEPQYGERVPYVVVSGAPGARLVDRCVAPEDLLANSHLQLDAEYYISKNLIPPLERIFNLVGANVRQWYDEMPKVQRIHRIDPNHHHHHDREQQLVHPHHHDRPAGGGNGGEGGGPGLLAAHARKKATLESYMKAAACLVCHAKTQNEGPLCNRCRADAHAPASLLTLQARLGAEEAKLLDVIKVCQSCAGLAPLDSVPCDSKDCPVFYTRMKQGARYRAERGVIEPAMKLLLEGDFRLGELEW
ncbi:hypothetical protein DL764_002705 [Monosporascus ibericus]|uniref:DNA polymerase n=1 Tax=Monosporascus ibericus TaxID=155417 RepID=A0A4Q4TKN5_9PEZI|nr:hypothetical protein DL764_002705 [Monosporascus ibericus]